MIEITDKNIPELIYERVKEILLLKKDNPSFNYEKHQHHLYEEREHPGISKNFYNEKGHVEFENIYGFNVIIEIIRWHPHKHNGYSGLNSFPCLEATIYFSNNKEKKVLWQLIVKSGTLLYEAKVTNLEIPEDILVESEKITQNQKIIKP